MKKKKMVSLAMAGTLALSTLLTGCGGERRKRGLCSRGGFLRGAGA